MTEYFKVKVLKTKGGRTGATMSSALLEQMPQPTMKKTPSNITYVIWFDNRRTATEYMESVKKTNDWRY